MLKTINLTLDVDKGEDRFSTLDERIELRQGDALAYVLDVYLREESEVLDLTGKAVRLYAKLPNSTVIDGANVEVVSAEEGHIQYPIPKELTQTVGNVDVVYFRITDEDPASEWSASTPNIPFSVRKGVAFKVRDEDYFPEFDGIMADLEASRVAYEQSEEGRETAEDAREQAEESRIAAETARASAETARAAAEAERATAEAERVAAETARIAAEAARAAAEAERAAAEAQRLLDEAKRKADFADMAASLTESRTLILAADQYDADGRPNFDGQGGIIYYVPVTGSDDDHYNEWAWVGGAWERLGTTQANLAAVSTDAIDAIVAGEDAEDGNEVVTQTGLKYLWAKLVAWATSKFAAIIHSHSAVDVTMETIIEDVVDTVNGTTTTNTIYQGGKTVQEEIMGLWDSQSRVSIDGTIDNNGHKLLSIITVDADGRIYRLALRENTGEYMYRENASSGWQTLRKIY